MFYHVSSEGYTIAEFVNSADASMFARAKSNQDMASYNVWSNDKHLVCSWTAGVMR